MANRSDADRARTESLRAQLAELYGLECVPKWGTPRNLSRKTYGPKVAKVAARLGTPLMPWQRYVLDVSLEVDPVTGLLVYRDVVTCVPRQSGKTTKLLAKMVWRANAWARQNIMYAAQNRLSARRKWEREHVATLDLAEWFRGKYTVRRANGDEAIMWRNGSWHGITSTTETAAHGESLDQATIDEAFALEDDRMEAAFSPAMITRPQPQQDVVSTAGTIRSKYLNAKRETGRALVEAAVQSTMAYFDWTAEDEIGKGVYDRTDPATWLSCMPALCPTPGPCTCSSDWRHTVTHEAVRAELTKMKPAEFDRAYLNVTRMEVVEDDPNVPVEVWPDLADPASTLRPPDVAFAVDVTPDRAYTSIGAAGVNGDGLMHVELIDRRPGTDWVVDRLVQLAADHRPVGIGLDSGGPAGSLLPELRKAKIIEPEKPTEPQRGQLALPTVRDIAAMAGAFADDCRQDRLRHIGQPELAAALAGARTKPLADSWKWTRRGSSTDISPLVAVTIARWVWETRAHLVRRSGPNVW